jgi:hypothetical protein
MVLPVTLTGCIIGSLPVLLLYPTLVVRFIIRHTLHLPTGTLILNCTYTLFGLLTMRIGPWPALRGVKFFLGYSPKRLG